LRSIEISIISGGTVILTSEIEIGAKDQGITNKIKLPSKCSSKATRYLPIDNLDVRENILVKTIWSCPQVIEQEPYKLVIPLDSICDQLFLLPLLEFFGTIFCFQSQFLILETYGVL